MNKAVFIDRDGTVNVEKEYLYRCEDFEFIAGVPQSIKILNDAGYLVVVVTNQSGVARGFYSEHDVKNLHRHVNTLLAEYSAVIDAFYYCPHHPRYGNAPYRCECRCRKGQPGMLLQAAAELNIDLSASYMIGDKLADIEAGEAAGCESMLVLTGYGSNARREISATTAVYPDLPTAVESIVSSCNF